jgi:U3 small nucleolar RNA-associated protein 21
MSTVLAFSFGKMLHTNFLSWVITLDRANRSQYSEVAFRAISEDNVADAALPSMQGSEEDEGGLFLHLVLCTIAYLYPALEALEALGVEDKPTDVFSTPSQLDGDLVTLTLLPRARWQTLLNLEVIQVRTLPFVVLR